MRREQGFKLLKLGNRCGHKQLRVPGGRFLVRMADKPSGTSRKMESVKPSRFRINQESRIPDHKMKSAVYHQTCTFQ